MNFTGLLSNLITLLGDNADGEWETIGYPQRTQSAHDIKTKRTVTVYVDRINFEPDAASAQNGPVKASVNFVILLAAAAAASSDNVSAYNADRRLDDLFERIWGVLMDARNQDLGAEKYTVANRYVSSYEKSGPPEEPGELSVMRGEITLRAEIMEDTAGLDSDTVYTRVPYAGTTKIDHDSDAQSGTSQAGEVST